MLEERRECIFKKIKNRKKPKRAHEKGPTKTERYLSF
jgi:hypothetical protein